MNNISKIQNLLFIIISTMVILDNNSTSLITYFMKI